MGRLLSFLFGVLSYLIFFVTLVDHFALFGLKQVYRRLRSIPDEPLPFKTPTLYKAVRHPLYFGFIVAFWSTPKMTLGHMFFAVMTTAYIMVAIQFEERDLIESCGDTYREYRRRVSMLLPLPEESNISPLRPARLRPTSEIPALPN